MALTHKEACDQLPQEHKDALDAAGVDWKTLIAKLLKLGCTFAPEFKDIVAALNVAPAVKLALDALIDLVCPPAPVPAP